MPPTAAWCVVRLTATGRNCVDEAMEALLESERELVSQLPPAKRDRLAALLRELLVATGG